MSIETVDKLFERYSSELKIELENLKECQKNKNINSCFKCEMIFTCETRKKYVKAVYDSMSHGESGGFEF